MAGILRSGRSLRNRKYKGFDHHEDIIKLDYSKDTSFLLKEIFYYVATQKGISKNKRIGYYNALVRLVYRFKISRNQPLTCTEQLLCLRVGLLHTVMEVRAACLRALRYYCDSRDVALQLFKLKIDYLIARSLDLCSDNDVERIQAMRLLRHLVLLCPEDVPQSLLRVIVSIANDGYTEHDRVVRVCLATLSELAFLNPELVHKCGGLSAIMHGVLTSSQYARVTESLLCPLLHLLNHPATRHLIPLETGIEQLLAPLTEFQFGVADSGSDTTAGFEQESPYTACKMAIATIVKSWPGLLRLCQPDSTSLHSLIGILYLSNAETRKEVLDVFFDVFRLTLPTWTEDFAEALLSIDPSEKQDSWKLSEGFIAAEGSALLPHLAQTRPNLVDNHQAVLLATFVSAGLFEALVELATSSEDCASIRATILLGELLHMVSVLLPHEVSYQSYSLPTLIDLAVSKSVSYKQNNLAHEAIRRLEHIHALKKRGVIPNSMFLDQLVYKSRPKGNEWARPLRASKSTLDEVLKKDTEHDVGQVVKDSKVLQTKQNSSWDWDMVEAILKWPDANLKRLEDQSNLRFIRRLLYYFNPSSKLFALLELTDENCRTVTISGQLLLDFLLESDHEEARRYLTEFFEAIDEALQEVIKKGPMDSLLTPSNLSVTCCRFYFLYIGRLSSTIEGNKLLETIGIYQRLLSLISPDPLYDKYVKLIVSGLDYSRLGETRVLLNKALHGASDAGRLYVVQLLRVLMRLKITDFQDWGMKLLVEAMFDPLTNIAMEAVSIVSEACENQLYLQSLVEQRPSVHHLGQKGVLLLARILGVQQGFNSLQAANQLETELIRWHSEYNQKYVAIVEDRLNEAFMTYERTYDGALSRRSALSIARKDVFIPVHLYGQLVQHVDGYELLCSQMYLDDYCDTVKSSAVLTADDMDKMKTALWALAHIGRSERGVMWLEDHVVVPSIVKMAEESPVCSMRGTCVYVLGLIAGTRRGVKLLHSLGWDSVCHKRSDIWPVIDPEPPDLEESDGDSVPSYFYTPHAPVVFPGSSPPLVRSPPKTGDNIGHASPWTHMNVRTNVDFRIGSSVESSPVQPRQKMFSIGGTDVSPQVPSHKVFTFDGADSTSSSPRIRSGTRTTLESVDEDSDFEDCTSAGDYHPKGGSQKHARVNWSELPTIIPDPVVRVPATDGENRGRAATNTSLVPGESITSGIASAGSSYLGNHFGSPLKGICVCSDLTPIPSCVSIPSVESSKDEGLDVRHPCDVHRVAHGLKKIPPHRRRFSNPILTPVLRTLNHQDSLLLPHYCFQYTSPRDMQGYSKLRELRRVDTVDIDQGPGPHVQPLTYDDMFDLSEGKRHSSPNPSFQRNASLVSLHDGFPEFLPKNWSSTHLRMDGLSLHRIPTLPNIKKPRPKSTGAPEFMGICLPMDISMLFQIDPVTSQSPCSSSHVHPSSRPSSKTLHSPPPSPPALRDIQGLENHTQTNCLLCGVCGPEDDDSSNLQNQPSVINHTSSLMSSSLENSTQDHDVSLDEFRKEVITLVVSMSGSIGTKTLEMELLSLRQKQSSGFSDLCLYSEICYLLGHYNYRLTIRRFIQDLFQEMDFTPLLEHADKLVSQFQLDVNPMATASASETLLEDFPLPYNDEESG